MTMMMGKVNLQGHFHSYFVPREANSLLAAGDLILQFAYFIVSFIGKSINCLAEDHPDSAKIGEKGSTSHEVSLSSLYQFFFLFIDLLTNISTKITRVPTLSSYARSNIKPRVMNK